MSKMIPIPVNNDYDVNCRVRVLELIEHLTNCLADVPADYKDDTYVEVDNIGSEGDLDLVLGVWYWRLETKEEEETRIDREIAQLQQQSLRTTKRLQDLQKQKESLNSKN